MVTPKPLDKSSQIPVTEIFSSKIDLGHNSTIAKDFVPSSTDLGKDDPLDPKLSKVPSSTDLGKDNPLDPNLSKVPSSTDLGKDDPLDPKLSKVPSSTDLGKDDPFNPKLSKSWNVLPHDNLEEYFKKIPIRKNLSFSAGIQLWEEILC